MKFERLRLAGFKSFCDSTEFQIEPGLTGVVGPNGCGKSNVVEALRWAMGENSAHSLRAGHVTEALAQGADRAAIKRQTGHRSDAMLDRYARETNLAANNSSAALGL